jgi:peptidoglycan/LPS O-acetylase OafA/YrhL
VVQQRPRLAHIDGLRALAVLSVMFFHARVHAPNLALDPISKEGSHGVDLFFVISGFCLALPTLDRLRRASLAEFDVVGYAAKRCLRILPPYAAAVLIVSAVGGYLMWRGIPLPQGMPASFGPVDVLQQLFFLDRDFTHINRSFWSLAVEFRWYFIFPLALALFAYRPRAYLTALVLVAIASELTRATSTDLGVLPAFLLGIIAADVFLNERPIAKYALPLCLLSVVFGLCNEARPHFPIQTNVGWHLAAFFFVIYAGSAAWLRALLSQRLLVAIGIASYSIYLLHEPLVAACMAAFAPSLGELPATLIAVAAGIAAGAVLWALVERPTCDRRTVAAVVEAARREASSLFARLGLPESVTLRRPSPLALRLARVRAAREVAGAGSLGEER